MANKRIVALNETAVIKEDMALPVDHENDGTHKIKVSSLIDKTLSMNGRAADAGAVGERLNRLAEKDDSIDGEIAGIKEQLGSFAQELEVDEEGLVYLLNNGERIAGPYGPFAGGGGGGTGQSSVTIRNTTGWLSKTIANNKPCPISFTWSSLEEETPTGNGTLRITKNGAFMASKEVAQGSVSLDLQQYLSSGSNSVRVQVSDVYGVSKALNFSVTVVELTINSLFDTSSPFTGDIRFSYTPVGAVAKTVHFIVDNVEVATYETTVSGRQLTQTIPAQTHGAHSLRVYFEATIDGETVRSNELYYEFMSVDPESTVPIIASSFHETSLPQYSTIALPFMVYTPGSLTSDVTIKANGTVVSTQTVDRTEQSFSYKANAIGTLLFAIETGSVTKNISVEITESEIDVEAETEDLVLYLSAQGRSNAEANPAVWTYEDIACTFTDFNFTSDGWQKDADDNVALRVAGDARLTIPYKIFENDFRGTGKTIELEFATKNVLDYDTPILTCMSGNRGLSLTAQKAVLKSEQSEISTQYKEDDHIRVTFVAEKRSENRLLFVYINAIPSGVIQYPTDDDFSQTSPVNISVGSNDCTIDLYCIRVYDNNLTRNQVLENWIADTPDGTTMLERYTRNNIYDAYGKIVIENLPSYLPYFILNAEELPQYKGDKKTITGTYVDPMYPSKSFTFTGCQINVQGTSSAPYARKNYDMQFKQGFELPSGHADNYELRTGAIPFNRFVLKADVASSEGANNVELVRLYNDACPYKTPEMEADSRVRWGIDGFPIVVFWNDTATNTVSFLGKYNFNLPKRAPAPYGYADSDTMESWEFQNNTSNLLLFKSDYFDPTTYVDDEGNVLPNWRKDFEARFPSDEWLNTEILQEFSSFVVSTDRTQATGDEFGEPVVIDGVEYTADTAEYRLARFRAEFPTYAELDTFLFYYIFTELFLMVDSRAKNLFIGFNGSAVTEEGREATRKATAQPYDMDTGLGTNNEGSLVFGYSLEDTDHLAGGANIFNGQDSVLWCNVRDAFPAEIVRMYQTLRANGLLSYATVEQRYKEHQSKWPEAIWIEDSQFKYIDPLINPDPGKEPTAVYLPMMQGSKEEQRKWWLSNRFKYMDSKWNAGDALSQVIQLRGYAKANITVTPYADIYPAVKYGSYLVRERGQREVPTTLVCPIDQLSDTEIYIYSAPQLADVGDLAPLKVGFADFSMATNLQSIKIGDADTEYENTNLAALSLGSNKLLKVLDVRNCSGLGDTSLDGHTQTTVDISGCAVIEEVYFDGTKVTGVTLPNGGVLRVLSLPSTITSLIIRNQTALTNFSVEGDDYSHISTLRLENVSAVIDEKAILHAIPAASRVRLIGFYWTATDYAEIKGLFDLLDTMRGLDEQGGNVDTAQVSGEIHTESLTGAQIAELNARYPYVNVTADHTSAVLSFYNGSTLITTQTVLDGGDGSYSGSTPTKTQDAQYTYAFAGWSKSADDNTVDADALTNVVADRSVFACYTGTLRKYTVTFVRGSADGGGTLQTINNVDYGTVITAASAYTGATPTTTQGDATDYPFEGWNPASATVQGDTVFTAKFGSPIEVAEITDSWDTIIANIDNGTYSTVYKVGNYKPLDLGTEGTINMQIVAMDADELADGSGYAPLTFLGMELLESTTFVFDSSKYYDDSDWGNSNIRTYLSNTILPLIPQNVKNRLQSVIKSYLLTQKDPITTKSVTTMSNISDKIWIPSARELGSQNYEDEGVRYNALYTDDTSRQKVKHGTTTAKWYWLRTAEKEMLNAYVRVNTGGLINNQTKTNANGSICLGFCLGLEPETITDSWETILANENYATDYAIGDTKYLDLGTEGKHLMEIVGIDVDDRADGTGKAGLTWISKTLLNTTHRMNPADRSGAIGTGGNGGWENCEMRTYLKETIKPLIPETVRNGIVEVTKVQSTVTDGTMVKDGQTSTEDVWIPSNHEIFNTVTTYESTGATYTKFASSADRIKKTLSGTASAWWLRSANSSTAFRYVYSIGTSDSINAYNTLRVALGFCTN